MLEESTDETFSDINCINVSFCWLVFLFCHTSRLVILVPQPGIKPGPSAVKVKAQTLTTGQQGIPTNIFLGQSPKTIEIKAKINKGDPTNYKLLYCKENCKQNENYKQMG